jgi:copper chaperone CopZ
VISNKIKFLAVGIALIGAASFAYACDQDKASSKNTSASVASTEGAGCGTKSASTTKVAGADGCCAKGAKTSATMASTAGGDHCAAGSKSAMALAYGKNTVTAAGTCPAKNEADYSFYVAGAECKGTGSAVAQTVKSIKGVSSVTVDYANHMVYVCADGKTASKKSIESSLKTAGYDEVKFVNASKNNCSKSHGKVEA